MEKCTGIICQFVMIVYAHFLGNVPDIRDVGIIMHCLIGDVRGCVREHSKHFGLNLLNYHNV